LAGTGPQDQLTHVDIRLRGTLVPTGAALARLCPSHPQLRSVTVISGGAPDPAIAPAIVGLHRECRRRGFVFSADFVLEADADACAALVRQPTSLGPILELSRALRLKGVAVRWWVPILEPLAYRLEAIFSLADDERIDAVLVPAAVATLVATCSQPGLNDECRRFFRDFVAYRLLDEERRRLIEARAAFYQSVHNWLGGSPLSFGEERERIGVLELNPQGEWSLRSELRPLLTPLFAHGTGTRTTTRQPGGHHGRAPLGEVAAVFAEGGRAVGQWAGATVSRALHGQNRRMRARRLPRVLAIGAYGGDHIGDTAILGGVLLRMHSHYGTEHATLVSQRPEHSARLAAMLDVPVSLSVQEYRQSTVAELLERVDGVVFAGGPLMDLPKQLVKHLYTVSRARRGGKPFIVEGIGAGPFLRRLSAWTARRFVVMADRVTVRTTADSAAPLVRGVQPVVGRDPAFDYLETRGPVLTRLPDADRQWLETLLKGTEGRVTVAINLRPLRPDYTSGAPAAQRAEYTRFVEARFEERLAEAMKRFHKITRTPCFVFFPMNAIQFGSSDLRSAYRIKRLVRGDVDFRVWEGDPSIDGVLALLRRVNVAMTMRFHATIYALSQQTPVIGVDYRPGVSDKVAALLGDAGQGQNCGRIDEVTTDWLVERLIELTGTTVPTAVAPHLHGTDESRLRLVQPPVPR
jgi:polysaccharide pyruvyl transferase WcaK-like protein